jgi:hypothetical protein
MVPGGVRRNRLCGVLVAGLLTLAACSTSGKDAGQPGDAANPSSDGNSKPPKPEVTPAANSEDYLADEAVPLEGEGIVRAVATNDLVLTMNGRALTALTLPDLEPAFAAEPEKGFWTDLWIDRSATVGYAIATEARQGNGTRVGEDLLTLREFDLDSGEVRREQEIAVPRDVTAAEATAQIRIKGRAGDDLVILERTTTVGKTRSRGVLAVDLGSGKVAWRVKAGQLLAVNSRVVLVATGVPFAPGPIRGLVPETGKRAWSALPTTALASLVGVSGRRALVAVKTGEKQRVVAISLRTGRVSGKATRAPSPTLTCGPAAQQVTVCSVPGNRVVGWDLGTNAAAWSLPTPRRRAPSITLHQGELSYGRIGDGWVAVDARTGKDVASGGGGFPIAVNDYGAVFLTRSVLSWVPAAEPPP